MPPASPRALRGASLVCHTATKREKEVNNMQEMKTSDRDPSPILKETAGVILYIFILLVL